MIVEEGSYRTNCGHPVRIIGKRRLFDGTHEFVGVVDFGPFESVFGYTADGKYVSYKPNENLDLDLDERPTFFGYDPAACGVCGAKPGVPCDAGFHAAYQLGDYGR